MPAAASSRSCQNIPHHVYGYQVISFCTYVSVSSILRVTNVVSWTRVASNAGRGVLQPDHLDVRQSFCGGVQKPVVRAPLPVLGREVPRFATSSHHQLIDRLSIQLQPPRRVGRANTALAREAKLWLAFPTPPAIRLPTPLCRAPWLGAGWLSPETPAFR